MQLLTLARDLRRRKARERRTLFVAEGVRTVEELLRSPLSIRGALTTAALREHERGRALLDSLEARDIEHAELDDKDFLSAADTERPQGILAIAEVPSHSFASLGQNLGNVVRLLVLDGIQDPGNTGTLVRTGAALGAAAIIALPGTADLWNAKAVRAAAGALFRTPTVQTSLEELQGFLAEQRIEFWGTAADGSPLADFEPPSRLALAVGNEGAGLHAAVRGAAGRVVALPMSPGVESLNVAVAAGIALYALRP